jgi:16S rRNA (guanine(1405)-N(7))-methyltransferase
MDKIQFQDVIDGILTSRKYRDIQIPRETVADLLETSLNRYSKNDKAIQSVREKLHNIIAPYLETLDYEASLQKLKKFDPINGKTRLRDFSHEILSQHHSTRERLPYIKTFFQFLFSRIEQPATVLDLACGLNPIALSYVDIPKGLTYFAYDLHQQRVNFINTFFKTISISAKAVWQDIIVNPPTRSASAAFFFKEAHRIEKREKGATWKLLTSLNVPFIYLSLPTRSLNGYYDLRPRMNALVNKICEGIGVIEHSEEFPAEIVYEIRRIHE